jgi:hypothetical protein
VIDEEASLLQPLADESGNLQVVFDQEQSHRLPMTNLFDCFMIDFHRRRARCCRALVCIINLDELFAICPDRELQQKPDCRMVMFPQWSGHVLTSNQSAWPPNLLLRVPGMPMHLEYAQNPKRPVSLIDTAFG